MPNYDINNPQAKQLVLEELVNQQLFVIDAEQKGIANQKDIVEAMEEMRRTLLVHEVAKKLVEGSK